jgi:hypothetical protein
MFSRIPHRTIFAFTIITEAVNSLPNTYWSKRSGELRPGQYQGEEDSTDSEDKTNHSLHIEENKIFGRKYKRFPLFPFSTMV